MPKSNAAVLDSEELDLELPDEDEDYAFEDDFEDDDLIDDEDNFDDDEDDEDLQVTPQRRRPENDLATQLQAVTAERDSLKSRIGDVVRKSGERVKEYRQEAETWAENLQEHFQEEAKQIAADAFEEGVRSVEKRLLPLLAPEEKSEYLEDVRTSPQQVSPREVTTVSFKTKDVDTGVSAVVDQFRNLGVPLDQLDTASVETVVESGTKFLTSRVDNLSEQVENLQTKVERRSRDDSGATRVTGVGGSNSSAASAPNRSLQRQLEEIDARIVSAKKRHDIDGYTALKIRRDQVVAQIRQRAARNR